MKRTRLWNRVTALVTVALLCGYLQPLKAVSHAAQRDTMLITPSPIARVTELRSGVHATNVDSLRSEQWPLARLGIPENADGSSITMAICDTGARLSEEVRDKIAGGWDFYRNSPTIEERGHHGTDVLEVVAGKLGGLASANIRIYNITDAAGNLDLNFFPLAVDKAMEDGVRVMVCCWGARTPPPDMIEEASARAADNGILLIVPTEDLGIDVDVQGDLWNVKAKNVLRVTGTMRPSNEASQGDDQLDPNYAWGHGWVDLAAPGEALAPDSTPSSFHWLSGTSIAAPWTAVVAVLVWAQDTNQNFWAVRNTLMGSAVPCGGLEDKVFSEGRVSAERALAHRMNSPLDEVAFSKLKLKNGKKLSGTLEGQPFENSVLRVSPAYRVYVGNVMIATMPSAGSFGPVKGKWKKVTAKTISAESSKGGRNEEPFPAFL